MLYKMAVTILCGMVADWLAETVTVKGPPLMRVSALLNFQQEGRYQNSVALLSIIIIKK